MEILRVEDTEVDYEATLEKALAENGFIQFRVNPQLSNEENYRPKYKGVKPGMAHFFRPPAGSNDIKKMPKLLSDRLIREPRDIREVIAVGKTLDKGAFDYWIYAPGITGEARKLLRISRFPEWKGAGLTISGFDPDDDQLSEMDCIGFSDGETLVMSPSTSESALAIPAQ